MCAWWSSTASFKRFFFFSFLNWGKTFLKYTRTVGYRNGKRKWKKQGFFTRYFHAWLQSQIQLTRSHVLQKYMTCSTVKMGWTSLPVNSQTQNQQNKSKLFLIQTKWFTPNMNLTKTDHHFKHTHIHLHTESTHILRFQKQS